MCRDTDNDSSEINRDTNSHLRPELPSSSKAHKRAVSAPDFSPLKTTNQASISLIPETLAACFERLGREVSLATKS